MVIRIDELTDTRIHDLLNVDLQNMKAISPPKSVHALDLDKLKEPSITFWTAWEENELFGCGALKKLDPKHAEVKSMRTESKHLRKGVARRILAHMLNQAESRGYGQVSLETGSRDEFEPARQLYASLGFEFCGLFADYINDPNSVFMTKEI